MLRNILKKLRFANNRLTKTKNTKRIEFKNTEVGVRKFVEYLESRRPFAAGKIGTAEILGLEYHDRIIRWPLPGMSWRRPANRLANNAGFFPVEKKAFSSWNQEMRRAVASLDFICRWQKDPFLAQYERNLVGCVASQSWNIPMSKLGVSIFPLLASCRLLFISPFVETMKSQLPHLRQIHDSDRKTDFAWEDYEAKISFLKCPLQWHLSPSPFRNWVHGLEEITKEALAKEFDIALIGAGAWSLPLAARIKKAGRAAIHTGGETQLFFGIRGKRWDKKNLYNPFWVSCSPKETPFQKEKIDNGCYW
jgi:hypothetical protein